MPARPFLFDASQAGCLHVVNRIYDRPGATANYLGKSVLINANSTASRLKELTTTIAAAVAPAPISAVQSNAGAKEISKAAYADANPAALDTVGGIPKMAADDAGKGWLRFLEDCDKLEPRHDQ